jgi:hypothetical protein
MASAVGLNARAVRLAHIGSNDLRRTGNEESESFQLLLELLDRHIDGPCGPNCPYPELMKGLKEENDRSNFASTSPYNAVDTILIGFLADIFGANEPSDFLVGADHKFYIIDNEQMFAMKPSGRIAAAGLRDKSGADSESARTLLLMLCRKIASLRDDDLRDFAKHPHEYRVDILWPILPILRAGKKVAQSIVEHGPMGCYP